MIQCEMANRADIQTLKQLWHRSFDDTDQAIDLFFSKYFIADHCAVVRKDEQLVAALHMLPANLLVKGVPLSCHYVYAAATFPEFRGKGYMGTLLEYTGEQGRRRGDAFSLLVPANKELFSYYDKQGYHLHSRIRTVTLSRADCVGWLRKRNLPVPEIDENWIPEKNRHPDFERLWCVRDGLLSHWDGSLLWNRPALERAFAMTRVYGGTVIQPDEGGFAFIRRRNEHTLEIQECLSSDKTFDKIIVEMVKLPFKDYSFRLPVHYAFFGVQGKEQDFSMIKPLQNGSAADRKNAYVGLPLD